MSVKEAFIITPRYEEWLVNRSSHPIPYKILLEVMGDLAKGYVSSKRNSFTATSAGKCKRRQVLAYLKLPKAEVVDPKTLHWFLDGNWRHVRWQVCLRAAGILSEIEVKVWDPVTKVSARLDGLGVVPLSHPNPDYRGKEFAFELKGRTPYKYERTTWEDYRDQVKRCFRARRSLELYVVIVENKGTQDYREWVIRREDVQDLLDEEEEELRILNRAVRGRRLPPLLSVCEAQAGKIWDDCPYGGVEGTCYKYKDTRWPGK